MARIDIKKLILEMARRNKNINSSVPASKELEKYKYNSNIYISYTNIDKIGINPRSEYNTPLGIYCYPIREMYNNVVEDNVPFASNRPYIWVLEQKYMPNMVFLDDMWSYTDDDLRKDINKIREKYEYIIASTVLTKDRIDSERMREYVFWDFIEDCEKTAKPKDIEFAKLWNITRRTGEIIANSRHYKGTNAAYAWNYVFRSIGYSGVAAKHDEGIIHSSEPTQAVFFTTKAFNVVEKIHNKKTKQEHNTLERTAKIINLLHNEGIPHKEIINHPEYDHKGLPIIADEFFRKKGKKIPEEMINDFISKSTIPEIDALLKKYIVHGVEAPVVLYNNASLYMKYMYNMIMNNKFPDPALNMYSKLDDREIKQILKTSFDRNLDILKSGIDIPEKFISMVVDYYFKKYKDVPYKSLEAANHMLVRKIARYFIIKYGKLSPNIFKTVIGIDSEIRQLLMSIDNEKHAKKLIEMVVKNKGPVFDKYLSAPEQYIDDIVEEYIKQYGDVPRKDFINSTPFDKKNIMEYYSKINKDIPDYMIYGAFATTKGDIARLLELLDAKLRREFINRAVDLGELKLKGPHFPYTYKYIIDFFMKQYGDVPKKMLNTMDRWSKSYVLKYLLDEYKTVPDNVLDYFERNPIKREFIASDMVQYDIAAKLLKLGIEPSTIMED